MSVRRIYSAIITCYYSVLGFQYHDGEQLQKMDNDEQPSSEEYNVLDSAGRALSKTFSELIEKLVRDLITNHQKYKLKLQTASKIGFSEYLDNNIVKCTKIKTIVNRLQPVSVQAVYEPLSFMSEAEKFSDSDINALLKENGKIILTGMGGCGKSITLKSLVLRSKEINKIPIYVELRQVEFDAKKATSIKKHIANEIAKFVEGFDVDCLIYGLKKGAFCLYLDGFDEISTFKKQVASIEIRELISDHPETSLLMCSRPDDHFWSWANVQEFEAAPLDKEQVISIVERAIFPNKEKERFVLKITDEFFEKYKSVLSNPLLVYMALLTSDEIQSAPLDSHIYYERSYQALSEKHDSLKADFSREYRTSLGSNKFSNVLETMSYFSFFDENIDFRNKEMVLSYIEEALGYEGYLDKETSDDFLWDLEKNVCMLFRDGSGYNFLHRSFQEYFAATYLIRRNVEEAPQELKKWAMAGGKDGVLLMMKSVDEQFLKKNLLKPILSELIEKMEIYKLHSDKIARIGKDLLVGNRRLTFKYQPSDTVTRYSNFFRTASLLDPDFPSTPVVFDSVEWDEISRSELLQKTSRRGIFEITPYSKLGREFLVKYSIWDRIHQSLKNYHDSLSNELKEKERIRNRRGFRPRGRLGTSKSHNKAP